LEDGADRIFLHNLKLWLTTSTIKLGAVTTTLALYFHAAGHSP
jgi:hypothetical protein